MKNFSLLLFALFSCFICKAQAQEETDVEFEEILSEQNDNDYLSNSINTTQEANHIQVDFETFLSEYADNEYAFAQKYLGNFISFRGKVYEIQRNCFIPYAEKKRPCALLINYFHQDSKYSVEAWSVPAFMSDNNDLMLLKSNQEFSFVCRVSDFEDIDELPGSHQRDIVLDNCRVSKDKE